MLRYRGLAVHTVLLVGLVFLWVWTEPAAKMTGTVKVYDRNGLLLYEAAGEVGHQEFVALDEIPQELQQAVVVAEDERFWSHHGVDVLSILRAAWQNLRAGQIVSGASTIPQQLVRFTVISPRTPAEVSWLRKIREVLLALRLSLTTSKREVLRRYLNTVHFGRQTYGVQAAAHLYFGKEVSNLSLAQSALLAGMIANPSKFDPLENPATAQARRDAILQILHDKQLVGQEQYERALTEGLPTEVVAPEFVAPHAVEMALEQLDKLGVKSDKGLSVYTTIDAGWYDFTRKIANQHVERLRSKHNLSNAAVVMIENSSGKILSLLGSIDYFDDSIEGKNNMALALRQPGSALKPVTYTAAFQAEIATPATLIDDSPKVYLTKKGEGFLPHNYDGRYRGPVLVREALASSYNLPAVEMLDRVGIDNFLALAHAMGITSMKETERYDLALTLGGGEVNLLEMTNLYATFARGGVWEPTQLIEQVRSDDGTLLYQQPAPQQQRVLDRQVAWLLTDILSDPKARIPTFGEKNPLVLSLPAAVKTGTTTDWHDNWTIGYTPEYTVGVWVGNADNSPMREITGVTGAAPIWQQIMEELLQFAPSGEFIRPEGIVEAEVCAWDGLLPTDTCTERYREKFIAGTAPTKYSTLAHKPTTGASDNEIQIINPREGAIFEIGAAENERIVFEISPANNIKAVQWEMDGVVLRAADCGISCPWTPREGKHLLDAKITMYEGTLVQTQPVRFEVIGYKEGW